MPRPTRVDCIIEGFEDNYIEVTGDWIRSEHVELVGLTETEEYLSWFRSKVTSMRLSAKGGGYVTDPQSMTMEVYNNLNLSLTGFVERSLYLATGSMRALGNASGRVSSGSSATKTISAPSPTPQ